MTRHASYKSILSLAIRLVILSLDIWGIFTPGLTQTAVYATSGPQGFFMGWFNWMKIPPLLAFGPPDTIYKNKCPDKRFGQIEHGLERGFVEVYKGDA